MNDYSMTVLVVLTVAHINVALSVYIVSQIIKAAKKIISIIMKEMDLENS